MCSQIFIGRESITSINLAIANVFVSHTIRVDFSFHKHFTTQAVVLTYLRLFMFKTKTEIFIQGTALFHLAIIIVMVIILPNEYQAEYQWLVDLIQHYPLHTKGLYSESRPFLSFVITNYVAITSPIFALLTFLIGIIIKSESGLKKDVEYVTNGIWLTVSIFCLYFISFNVNWGKHTFKGFSGDSLGAYITSIYACYLGCSVMSASLLLRLREYIKNGK